MPYKCRRKYFIFWIIYYAVSMVHEFLIILMYDGRNVGGSGTKLQFFLVMQKRHCTNRLSRKGHLPCHHICPASESEYSRLTDVTSGDVRLHTSDTHILNDKAIPVTRVNTRLAHTESPRWSTYTGLVGEDCSRKLQGRRLPSTVKNG